MFIAEIFKSYSELIRLCKPHTLLTLVKIENNTILPSTKFNVVYSDKDEKRNLSEYRSDLEKAIAEEYEIRRAINGFN